MGEWLNTSYNVRRGQNMPAHNFNRGFNSRSSFSLKEVENRVFIPFNSNKGDCPYCSSGVLFRNSISERKLAVPEAYTCDICGRDFIEGINFLEWSKFTKVTPRRYFIEALKE